MPSSFLPSPDEPIPSNIVFSWKSLVKETLPCGDQTLGKAAVKEKTKAKAKAKAKAMEKTKAKAKAAVRRLARPGGKGLWPAEVRPANLRREAR